MAPRTKILKNCVIAHTDDFPITTREQIKGWVEHAGGRISKEITDDVSHLILTRKDWNEYTKPKVRTARSKKTIYLMRIAWLEDSLASTKGRSKPLDECNDEYTWEIRHARKVIKHREIKKAEKRRETSRAKMLAARQERDQLEEDDIHDNQVDDAPAECDNQQDDTACGDVHSDGQSIFNSKKVDIDISDGLRKKKDQGGIQKKRNVDKRIVDAEKLRQIFECGIKFDRSILQTERDMAIAEYRSYTDPNGFVYMIMLVRDDIKETLQEQYKLKPLISPMELHHERGLPDTVDDITTKDAVTRRRRRGHSRDRGRFNAGKDTQLRYFEDPIYCKKSNARRHASMSIDKLNDGQCTPVFMYDPRIKSHITSKETVNGLTQQHSNHTEFARPAPHIPFSSLPVMPYTPLATSHPEIKVLLPRPFAYTLQLYESIDLPKFPCEDESCGVVSTTTNESLSPNVSISSLTSFTQYLPPSPSQDRSRPESTPSHPSAPVDSTSPPISDSTFHPPPKKTYMLLCQYTKKGKSKVSETTTLAPEGSTLELAMDTFRKIFRKKTGLNWDEARCRQERRGVNPSVRKDSSCDSGVGLSLGLDGIGPHETETGSTSSDNHSKQDSDDLNGSSGTIQDNSPLYAMSNQAANSTEVIQATNTNTVSPPSDTTNTSERDDPAPAPATTQPVTPWTLSSSKDVGRAGYRPFTYIATDRKTFEEGNEKYKAQYGEDLFQFSDEQDTAVVSSGFEMAE